MVESDWSEGVVTRRKVNMNAHIVIRYRFYSNGSYTRACMADNPYTLRLTISRCLENILFPNISAL